MKPIEPGCRAVITGCPNVWYATPEMIGCEVTVIDRTDLSLLPSYALAELPMEESWDIHWEKLPTTWLGALERHLMRIDGDPDEEHIKQECECEN